MTHVTPLSPIISNVVFDSVLRYWVALVLEEEAGLENFIWAVRSLVVLFYAKNGLLASTRSERLQPEFDAFTDLFYRVGL